MILGTAYLRLLIDSAVKNDLNNVIFFAHHPIQDLADAEETALHDIIINYTDTTFYWMCGDAHRSKKNAREYISLYQIGSLTGNNEQIPDFAIYDMNSKAIDRIDRKVFRYLRHLNNPPKYKKTAGGWKRVYIDPKAPSLHYDETLE